jgi:penicillin-binding protein 1A
VVILAGAAGVAGTVAVIASKLPQMITIADYKPREVAEVYDRKGQKIGEFFNEKRIVIPYEEIPKNAIHAFISAEDSSFFEHDGLNYVAILRAALANLKAGRKVQGG